MDEQVITLTGDAVLYANNETKACIVQNAKKRQELDRPTRWEGGRWGVTPN